MEKGYFAAAWGDITNSPGWISKLLRLGLLCLVPIFGQVVMYGYLYAWARDIAWNVHRPLPEKIFGNEDGNLYKRGFFIFLIVLVFSLVPGVFNMLSSLVSGTAVAGGTLNVTTNGAYYSYAPVMGGLFLSMVFGLISFALALAVAFFAWVGSMRTALYGTLSAGFQINKIWAMLRYDFMGLLRIFAMALIVGLVIGFFVMVALFLFVLMGGIAVFATSLAGSGAFAVAMVGTSIFFLLGVAVLLLAVFCVSLSNALVIRALGYWTRQFEVNRWGGQEDPMPFEQRAADQRVPGPQQSAQVPGAEAGAQQQAVYPEPGQADASFAGAGQPAPNRNDTPYAGTDQADRGSQASAVAQPASYDPSGSAPVQPAPYQVSQQPVVPAPFSEGQESAIRKADSPIAGNDEASEALGGESATVKESAPASSEPSAQSASREEGSAEDNTQKGNRPE